MRKKNISDSLTLVNGKLIRTQPPCFCKNLRLINCGMVGTGPAFEKSEVEAIITTKIDSIKNPLSGQIQVPELGELIMEDPNAKGQVLVIGLNDQDNSRICSCA